MSDIKLRELRVREQAEAQLRQLRTIPFSEALMVVEQLLGELYMLREVHNCERDYYREGGCSTDQES
jgi:hypothetical protein